MTLISFVHFQGGIPGVSFIQGENITLRGRDGNPDNAPFTIPVSEYEENPRWFHCEVMSALMVEPAADALVLGLESLFMEQRIPGGRWLYLE